MTRRWMWIGLGAALVALAGGGALLVRGRPQAQAQRPQDPAFGLILSIRTLERNPQTRLTTEQITTMLPFVKALKDVPLTDAEAALVIVRAVRRTFTSEQRAALDDARRRFEERRRSGGVQGGGGDVGEGGPPAGAPGLGAPRAGGGASSLTDEQRAQARTRAFERMIRYLERRMK